MSPIHALSTLRRVRAAALLEVVRLCRRVALDEWAFKSFRFNQGLSRGQAEQAITDLVAAGLVRLVRDGDRLAVLPAEGGVR
jgi:hypothetical protein